MNSRSTLRPPRVDLEVRAPEALAIRFCERIQRRLPALETSVAALSARYRGLLLAGMSICYLLVTIELSRRKPLWTDEFFTLYLARLKPHDLWAALLTGGDQHPPLYYLVHHFILGSFGEFAFTLRLPAILGFLLMMLCLYHFVARHTSVAYGFVAMLMPLVTIAHEYAYEARGYGPLVGFFALAALCWQRTRSTKWQTGTLVGLAAALAAGVCCHYYTVLLLPAIMAAEVTRSIRCRSWRWRVWLAFSAPLPFLLAFLPVIEKGRAFAAHFWARASAVEVYRYYDNVLGSGIICLLLCFAAGGIYRFVSLHDGIAVYDRRKRIPVDEIVLGAVLAGAPIIVYLFGKTITGVFVWRYAIGGVVGIAMLFGFVCFRIFRGSAVAAWFIIAILAISFGVAARLNMHKLSEQRASVRDMIAWTSRIGSDSEPLVIGDSGMFYVYSYYSAPAMKRHYLYLVDPQRSLKYLGQDTPDRSLSLLNPWFGLNVQPYASYVETHSHFEVCTSLDRNWDWLPYALIDEGKDLSVTARRGSVFLFSSKRDGGAR